MLEGKWLQPRYPSRETFEKDYSQIEFPGPDAYCPGCRKVVKLVRKSPLGKIAGWCGSCNRGVSP